MESLSSSVNFCPGGTHDSCSEASEDAGPALKEIWSRFAATKDQLRSLRAKNACLSEELSGLKQRWGRETQEVRQLFERELGRLRADLEAEAVVRSEAEVRREAAEAEIEALRVRHAELEAEVAEQRQRLENSAEEVGEKAKAVLVVRRRAELLEKERAAEREKRLRLRGEVDLLRAKAGSNAARLQLQETEKRRLQEELRFQLQIREQEQREMQHVVARRPASDLLLERCRAEHQEALEEAREEADRQVEAAEKALRLTYEGKFQEMLQALDGSSEAHLLRQQNQQLSQGLARLTEKAAELQAANEKMSFQLAEKTAAVEAGRRHVAASEKDLLAASVQARRLAEDAALSAKTKADVGRRLFAMRALMAQEEGEGPEAEARRKPHREQPPASLIPRRSAKPRATDQEQPTSDNPDHLKWTLNAAYHKPRETEKPSLSKPDLPHAGASMQGQQKS